MTINQPKPPSMRARTLFMFRRIIPPLDKEQRAEVRIKLHEASHPNFDFFLLTILSSVIATLGLLTDSAAVIIGAMLVAPLMSPIIGLGLGSLIGDTHLIQHAASALIRGAILAVLMAILLTWSNRFLPFIALQELPGEVMSRTHPSPIDLTIALAGGLAAAYALALPSLSAALPGVAIATALMPPLCTIGIGVAVGNWETAGGALLLFITNAVTIAFAAMLIFFILGFRPGRQEGRRLPRTLLASAVVTAILLVPLTYMGADFFRQATENRMTNTIIIEEIENIGAEMATLDLVSSSGSETLNMTITVRTPRTLSYQDVINLQRAIATRLQRPVAIKINQVFTARLDPLIPPTFTPTSTPPTFTPTATFTSTPTLTSTPTFTPTFTPTYTPTPTPALGQVLNNNGRTIDIFQRPEGPSIGKLRPGALITILYGSEVTNGLVWIEIMDSEGRIGWIPQIYMLEVTLTPTATQSLTPTP